MLRRVLCVLGVEGSAYRGASVRLDLRIDKALRVSRGAAVLAESARDS